MRPAEGLDDFPIAHICCSTVGLSKTVFNASVLPQLAGAELQGSKKKISSFLLEDKGAARICLEGVVPPHKREH